ncbi:hypothetical protein PLICRDRAFT_121269 [Plicaturopsis crispa FD-325 SS-3]|nr:hypothetical protein PLICRDRAFT_121269 [Plicaturopsis crispa FD-325 SS-3]
MPSREWLRKIRDAKLAKEAAAKREKEAVRRAKRRKLGLPEDPPKRPKTVRGKRGLLQKISEINLDVLGEASELATLFQFIIFLHLHPFDLLRLSWTTKALRNFLMHRKSALHIWRGAFQAVEGLPPCPPELSMPQYARLCFYPHCSFCFSPSVRTVRWACRVRCCAKCAKTQLLGTYVLKYSTPKWKWDGSNDSCPLPWDLLSRQTYLPRVFDPVVLKTDLDKFEATLKTLQTRSQVHEFIHEQTVRCHEIKAHAALCEEWHNGLAKARNRELSDQHKSRQDVLFRKLTELGWGEEIEKLTWYDIIRCPLLRSPRELTDRVWLNIKDEAIDFMQSMKTRRLQDEQRTLRSSRQAIVQQLYEAWVSAHINPTEAVPTVADVCEFEPFSNIISLPAPCDVTHETFASAVASLPAFVHTWRRDTVSFLISMVPGASTVADLHLATTFFHCLVCESPIQYPAILTHSCMARVGAIGDEPDGYETVRWEQCYRSLDCEPWNLGGKKVVFDYTAFQLSRQLISLCGQDHSSVTGDDMDVHPARFICKAYACQHHRYYGGRGEVPVLSWKDTVSHVVKHGGMGHCEHIVPTDNYSA